MSANPLSTARRHWLIGALSIGATGCARMPKPPATLATPQPEPWKHYPLPGKRPTVYEPMSMDGRSVVRARSQASASMWRKRMKVPPQALGRVRFEWLVDRLVPGADLRDVDRSDSPVNLVLAFDGDRSRLSARNRMLFELAEAVSGEEPPYATVMYVWSEQLPVGSVVRSGRSDRIRKIVVESGTSRLGRWQRHERNIAADFRTAFDEDPGPLIGIALMTDSDNTGTSAEAWYGEVELLP
jgi:hypothetical protein